VIRAAALIAVAALCVWSVIAFVQRPLTCNRSLSELRVRTRQTIATGSTYRQALLARKNLTDLRKLEGPCRARVELYVFEAENEDVLGNADAAIDALRRGLNVDQRPELYFNIGTLLVEQGRMDEAVENYTTAIRLTPDDLPNIPSPEAQRRVQERVRQLAARAK